MAKTPVPSSTPMFSTSIFSSNAASRPTTRDGSDPSSTVSHTLAKDRKASFSRKSSLSGSRRRGSSFGNGPNAYVTDAAAPPALPEYALAAAAKVVPRADVGKQPSDHPVQTPGSAGEGFGMLTRTNTGSTTYFGAMPAGAAYVGVPGSGMGVGAGLMLQQQESILIHQQITDLANKRIATLDYLRKTHEGRVYWFNTYLFDKPDLNRMPYFDPRKIGRKATNYLLLGLSIPTIVDLYSSTPIEFLRSLNTLLSEFDSFQQLHSETSSLSRARLPNMFRRQGGKSRRSTSAADMHPIPDDASPLTPAGGPTPPIMNFAASETDLLPGEEYSFLLTPSLPFDPDYFETFATLCDVLIDCYSRLLSLVPSAKDCSAPIAELFHKADSRIRKLTVQGLVKEFEDHSRAHIKSEVANIGKVVLGGLM